MVNLLEMPSLYIEVLDDHSSISEGKVSIVVTALVTAYVSQWNSLACIISPRPEAQQQVRRSGAVGGLLYWSKPSWPLNPSIRSP
jgi:hypothetical protein